MKRLIPAFLIGLLFGVGIVISDMGNPAKVLNFFDFAGTRDPCLIFVMGGALIVTFVGYRLVLRRNRPLADERFHVPTSRTIDPRLLVGAAVFGVGWGMAGFCPGGALPVIGTGRIEVLLFVAALIAGIFATQWLLRLGRRRTAPISQR